MARLKLSGYPTREDARTALAMAGYELAHSPPGAPFKWIRGSSVKAVAKKKPPRRKRDGWLIVPYPWKMEAKARKRIKKLRKKHRKWLKKQSTLGKSTTNTAATSKTSRRKRS